MVNAVFLTSAVAAVASAGMMRSPEASSSPGITQLAQTLPDTSCVNQRHTMTFVNNCPYTIHIWRDDSVVDKAAALNAGSEHVEVLREDWRSGIMSFRISPFETGPYEGKATSFISYYQSLTNSSGSLYGQGYNVFGDPFYGKKINVDFNDNDLRCKNANGKSFKAQDDIYFGGVYLCDGLITGGSLNVQYTFCA